MIPTVNVADQVSEFPDVTPGFVKDGKGVGPVLLAEALDERSI